MIRKDGQLSSASSVLRFPDWQREFEVFLAETDVEMLKQRLTKLESAIFFRLQELAGKTDADNERQAIEAAIKKVAEIQQNQLGFPTWNGNDGSGMKTG